jgi:CubicO group peptidase (beta-lactamase class C family)
MRFIKKVLFACLITLCCQLTAQARTLSPEQTAQLVNSVIKPVLQRNKVPGATVVLYNHGVPQAFYFGTATHNPFNHVNSGTVFEIGSVTKVFTSVLLAYESYIGEVDLDDPAIMYLRNAPTSNRAFDQITLAGLASHVSGLGQMPASTIQNRYQLMQSLKRWQPPYRVNSWWKYSNIGFGVLGYTLEDVSHQSYATMLKQQIFKPLKMSDSGLVGTPCFSCAQGYSWNGQAVTTTKTLLVIPAAGSIRSSGRDMLKFLGAALGLPGTPPDLAAAFRLTQMPYFQTQYGAQGLGWEIHDFNKLKSDGYIQARYRTLTIHSSPAYEVTPEPLRGVILYDKTGSVAGFRAYIAAVPATSTGIVILVNSAMPRTQVVLAARKVLYQMVRS